VRYEHLHLGEHHDHFYCLKCGKIIEFFSPEIEDWQTRVARDHEFHAFDHKMQIHGLCKKCFGSSKALPLSKVETGGKFRIVEVSDREQFYQGCKMVQRLMDMGILPGTEGTVINNHGGRIVLLINNSRVALGRGMSQIIKVVLIE
jgi:Fur family ferric uptake transcriptional regulator